MSKGHSHIFLHVRAYCASVYIGFLIVHIVVSHAGRAVRPRGGPTDKSRTGGVQVQNRQAPALYTPARTLAELASRQTVLNTACLTITVSSPNNYTTPTTTRPNFRTHTWKGASGSGDLNSIPKTVTCQSQ